MRRSCLYSSHTENNDIEKKDLMDFVAGHEMYDVEMRIAKML